MSEKEVQQDFNIQHTSVVSMKQFTNIAGLITFFLSATCATKIPGSEGAFRENFDFLFPGESIPESKCCSNTHCVPSSKCESLKGNVKQSQPTICGWNGNETLLCCPMKFERIVDRSECATFSTIRKKRDFGITAVGGVDAERGSWPWMAAIFVKEITARTAPFCGGSLISKDTILTAAHCFLGTDETSKFVVLLGDVKLGDESDGLTGVEFDVSRVISHEGYKYPSVYNDIAILKLATTVNFTPDIRMICLPEPTMSSAHLQNQIATLTGWGHLKFGGASSPALQEVHVPIVENSQCDQVYKKILGDNSDNLPNGITKDIICAGDENDIKDACQGDSGGPLVLQQQLTKRWVLIGIIASGYECGRGIPGIYTRVSEYIDWIGRHT